MINMYDKYKEHLIFLLSLFVSVVSYLLVCRLVSGYSVFHPDISSYAQYILDSNQLRPEPFERFCFVFGLFYLPVCFILAYIFFNAWEDKYRLFVPWYSNKICNNIQNMVILAALLFWGHHILKGASAGFENYIFKVDLNYYWLRLVLVLFIMLLLFRRKIRKIKSPLFFTAGIIIIFLTSITQINTSKIVIANPYINAHFTLLYGAINQVAHGKTILVDTVSTYGILYPYAGALFTKIAGFSILNVSIFFVGMIFFSFLFIYLALSEKIGYDSWLPLLFLLGLIGIVHPFYNSLVLSGGVNNTYYQYYPLRVIFGSFFIWFVLKYLKNSSRMNYFAGFLLSGISFLWNLDTGGPLAISWLGVLIFNTMAENDLTAREKLARSLKHLLYMGIALLSVAALYTVFAYIRTHQFPAWNDLIKYQKLFISIGLYMVPMRGLDLWNIVIAIYLFVLFSCLAALIRKRATVLHRYYFFIAVFGLGIFSYYQGRSLMPCLFPVSYPAVILAAFMLDDLSLKYQLNKKNLRYVLANNLFRFDFIKIFFLSIIIVYGIMVFFSRSPYLNKWVRDTVRSVAETERPLRQYIDYIKANKKNDEIIIFSDFNDYLYFETGTFSGLPFASSKDALTSFDWEKIRDLIKSRKVQQVYYNPGGVPDKFDRIFYPELTANYFKVNQSADGALILYEAKP
jgi:hypothetical protein